MNALDASLERRARYRQHTESLGAGGIHAQKLLCDEDPAHWVDHWVFTYDPRPDGLKSVPFDLFPVQRRFLEWLKERERLKENGLVEKSRDQGATYLCAAYAVHAWLFRPGSSVGFGSRKLDLVDRRGDPDCIFEKIRGILYSLPGWMLPPGFSRTKHDNSAKLLNPATGATITGEGGDDIGRGGRKTLYFVDEAAFLEHPTSVEKALSATTDVRIDVSTPNGPGNPFAAKRFSLPERQVFTLHYRDDPRKTAEWVAKKKASVDPVTWAQEYEIDYAASIEGICIPAAWVRAAVELLPAGEIPAALVQSGAEPLLGGEHAHGPIVCGFDVAEEGSDLCVLITRQGPVMLESTSWGQCNTTETAWRARDWIGKHGACEAIYDAGGPGVGVKGTWVTAEQKLPFLATPIDFGGKPTENVWPDGRKSTEIFFNRRAEMWWTLRVRFEKAYEFKVQGKRHPADEMISIPNHPQLIAELSLPLIERTEKGKIQLESKKKMKARGVKSPDFGDALALAFHTGQELLPFQIW